MKRQEIKTQISSSPRQNLFGQPPSDIISDSQSPFQSPCRFLDIQTQNNMDRKNEIFESRDQSNKIMKDWIIKNSNVERFNWDEIDVAKNDKVSSSSQLPSNKYQREWQQLDNLYVRIEDKLKFISYFLLIIQLIDQSRIFSYNNNYKLIFRMLSIMLELKQGNEKHYLLLFGLMILELIFLLIGQQILMLIIQYIYLFILQSLIMDKMKFSFLTLDFYQIRKWFSIYFIIQIVVKQQIFTCIHSDIITFILKQESYYFDSLLSINFINHNQQSQNFDDQIYLQIFTYFLILYYLAQISHFLIFNLSYYQQPSFQYNQISQNHLAILKYIQKQHISQKLQLQISKHFNQFLNNSINYLPSIHNSIYLLPKKIQQSLLIQSRKKIINSNPFFSIFSKQFQENICEKIEEINLIKGEPLNKIYEKGIIIIAEGKIKIKTLNDKTKIGILVKSQCYGIENLLKGKQQRENLVAGTNCRILLITKTSFLNSLINLKQDQEKYFMFQDTNQIHFQDKFINAAETIKSENIIPKYELNKFQYLNSQFIDTPDFRKSNFIRCSPCRKTIFNCNQNKFKIISSQISQATSEFIDQLASSKLQFQDNKVEGESQGSIYEDRLTSKNKLSYAGTNNYKSDEQLSEMSKKKQKRTLTIQKPNGENWDDSKGNNSQKSCSHRQRINTPSQVHSVNKVEQKLKGNESQYQEINQENEQNVNSQILSIGSSPMLQRKKNKSYFGSEKSCLSPLAYQSIPQSFESSNIENDVQQCSSELSKIEEEENQLISSSNENGDFKYKYELVKQQLIQENEQRVDLNLDEMCWFEEYFKEWNYDNQIMIYNSKQRFQNLIPVFKQDQKIINYNY